MEIHRLQFSIDVKAEKSRIWNALWEDSAYRAWAGVFSEGAYAVSDNWKVGSTVMFLGPDQSGIYSIIENHIPNKHIQFKHIGNVLKGEQQAPDEESKKWSGATESYSLIEGEESIKLLVEIDIMEEHLDFMETRFPKALEKIKNRALEQL